RRYHGDLAMAYRSVGRALLLCGATAIAGFGSLAWSSNAGMASLGAVCAVGIAGNMLISVLLLPKWWQAICDSSSASSSSSSSTRTFSHNDRDAPSPHGPSFLYCSFVWRLGLAVVRVLPEKLCARLSRTLANWYTRL